MNQSGEPLFALPRGNALRGNLVLSCLFGAYFLIVYWTGDFVAANSARFHVAMPFELSIPFIPWTLVLYLSITPFLCLAPFIFRTPERLLPLFATLIAEVTLAGIVFCLFPVELSFHDQQVTAAEDFLLWLTRITALQYNCVPSLHVVLALTAAWAYIQVGGRGWRVFVCCWVGAIVVSTVLGHQHHLADLAAGGLLTAMAIAVVPAGVRRWQHARSQRRGNPQAAAS